MKTEDYAASCLLAAAYTVGLSLLLWVGWQLCVGLAVLSWYPAF